MAFLKSFFCKLLNRLGKITQYCMGRLIWEKPAWVTDLVHKPMKFFLILLIILTSIAAAAGIKYWNDHREQTSRIIAQFSPLEIQPPRDEPQDPAPLIVKFGYRHALDESLSTQSVMPL